MRMRWALFGTVAVVVVVLSLVGYQVLVRWQLEQKPTDQEKIILTKLAPSIREFLNTPNKYKIEYKTLQKLVSTGRFGSLLRQTLAPLPKSALLKDGLMTNLVAGNELLDFGGKEVVYFYETNPDKRYYRNIGYTVTDISGIRVVVEVQQLTSGPGDKGVSRFITYLLPDWMLTTNDKERVATVREDNGRVTLPIIEFKTTNNPELVNFENTVKLIYTKSQKARDTIAQDIIKSQVMPKDIENYFWYGN